MLNLDEADRPLSVSELVVYLNKTLAVGGPLKVIGEVSALKIHGGHRYFDIKDEKSIIHATLFAGTSVRVKAMPEDGQRFIFSGKAELYAPNGKLSLIVTQVEFDDIGRLRAQLEALKIKLEGEGAFAPSRKRPLPFLPRKVGLITSPTGAVIHDLQETILHRFPNMDLALYPVNVQGATSAASVIAAIIQANRERTCDVLILARGGGSFEDMYAFNTEPVVRAILNSSIPILTALGHTTDRSLADMVSDWECRTPTEAGNKVVPDKASLIAALDQYSARLKQRMSTSLIWHERNLSDLIRRLTLRSSHHLLSEQKAILERLIARKELGINNRLRTAHVSFLSLNTQVRISSAQKRFLSALSSRLNSLEIRLANYSSLNRISILEKELKNRENRLESLAQRALLGASQRLESLRVGERAWAYFNSKLAHMESEVNQRELRLLALSPQATLNRGYAVVRDSSNQVISSTKTIKKGDYVHVHLSEGEFTSIIKEINK